VARWERVLRTVSGYACWDTATAGTPPGDRRYIRSDPPRLLLKLVRLVWLGINCGRLARTRSLVAAREERTAICVCSFLSLYAAPLYAIFFHLFLVSGIRALIERRARRLLPDIAAIPMSPPAARNENSKNFARDSSK